jgi:hypothetical protein
MHIIIQRFQPAFWTRLWIALFTAFLPFVCFAEQNHGSFNLTFENDIFALTDSYYTNGVNLTWMLSLPTESEGNLTRTLRLSAGQIMYTPEDITLETNPGDRPYAGIAYLGVGMELKYPGNSTLFQGEFGIVGPNSYAGDMQKFVHILFGYDLPKGWDNQLRAGPAVTLWGGHKRRIAAGSFNRIWSYEILGHVSAGLGNVAAAAAGGMEVRAGFNMKKTLGTFYIRPGSEGGTALIEGYAPSIQRGSFGFQVFFFAGGNAVLQNIFLDGTRRDNSTGVSKNNFFGNLILGIDLRWKKLFFRYSYVLNTRQFESQPRNHIFGSLGLGLTW